jgi:hypothetical protein
MTRVVLCGTLIALMFVGLACDEPLTAPPPPTNTQPARPTPEPPPSLPAGEPAATYVFSDRLDYNISGFTAGSRYLLYDNGMFGLRYDAFSHVYVGRYQQNNATITFQFDGSSTAVGTLKGDLLEIRYDLLMQHSDFENAVYRRSQ